MSKRLPLLSGLQIFQARNLLGFTQKGFAYVVSIHSGQKITQSEISRLESGIVGGWKLQRTAVAVANYMSDRGVEFDLREMLFT